MRKALIATCLLALLVGLTTTASGKEGTKLKRPATGQLGVIATESPAAARVGRAVLESGGNAVDAAAATVFAIGVARPQSCGIGGGGFMVYRSSQGKTDTLDFRETAPAAFKPRTLKSKGLHTDFTGHLTVGVPGTVAGLQATLKRYGTTSLAAGRAPRRAPGPRRRAGDARGGGGHQEQRQAPQALPGQPAAVPARRQAAARRIAAAPARHGGHAAADHPQRPARLLPRRDRPPDRGRHAPRVAAEGRPRHHAPARPRALRGQVAHAAAPEASAAGRSWRCPRPPRAASRSCRCSTCSRASTSRPAASPRPTRCTSIIEAREAGVRRPRRVRGRPGLREGARTAADLQGLRRPAPRADPPGPRAELQARPGPRRRAARGPRRAAPRTSRWSTARATPWRSPARSSRRWARPWSRPARASCSTTSSRTSGIRARPTPRAPASARARR